MLYLVPLEPLSERYTEQWMRWVPNALDSLGIDYSVIIGDKLTNKIETGDVLDAYGTHYWGNTQINQLISKIRSGTIKSGDTIWFADLWRPGLEALAYIRSITKIDFKITGVLHAGTWDRNDFTVRYGMKKWARGFEWSIFQIADEIYVGSQYHKNMILASRIGAIREHKIKVTGLFFDANEVQMPTKKVVKNNFLVVFPHRIAPEKRPELFEQLKTHFNFDSKYMFVSTRELCKNKEEYYRLLASAKYMVSFEGQETFGYCVLEAMACGCIPLVYDGMSYRETVPDSLRWRFEDQLYNWIQSGYTPKIDYKKLLEKYNPVNVAKLMFT